jgi:GTP-binding protein
VRTKDLNDWLSMATQRHPPPSVGGHRIKPRYMAQTKSRPPTFVLMAGRGVEMPESYKRYLVNSLRESFDLPGTPIRLLVKSGKNPYAPGEAKGGPAPAAYKPKRPPAKPKPGIKPKTGLKAKPGLKPKAKPASRPSSRGGRRS